MIHYTVETLECSYEVYPAFEDKQVLGVLIDSLTKAYFHMFRAKWLVVVILPVGYVEHSSLPNTKAGLFVKREGKIINKISPFETMMAFLTLNITYSWKIFVVFCRTVTNTS